MNKPLNGKVALVTGASRGIGRAVAERLARDGASVIVNYAREEAKAHDVVETIEKAGGRAVAIQADVSSVAGIRRLFAATIERFGKLDIVVANAGTSVFKPIALVTEEEFDKVFSLNARGTFFVLQEAANRVAEGGRIVAISTGGTQGKHPGAGLYIASKAAVEYFAGSLAKELGPKKITVNVVSPGLTETDGLTMPKHAVDDMVSQTPLGRLGQPHDVASAVAFLVGPDGAWVDGTNLLATGGV